MFDGGCAVLFDCLVGVEKVPWDAYLVLIKFVAVVAFAGYVSGNKLLENEFVAEPTEG